MKKNLFLSIAFSVCAIWQSVASDTVFVRETQIPVLIERQDNVLFMLRMNAKESRVLDEVVLNFGKDVNLSDIKSVKLYYSGTEARQNYGKKFFIRRERHWRPILLIRLISRKWTIRNRKLH